jgi:hypothetical protein
VTEVIKVGQAQDAVFHPSNYGSSHTAVNASGGSFLVVGTFQVVTGNDLVIEKLEGNSSRLCDQAQSLCKPLR